MARPSRYTPQLAKRICERLELGQTMEAAAGQEGLHVATLYEWQKKHAEFREAVTRARAKARGVVEGVFAAAALTEWKAAESYLERRWPKQWARRNTTRLEVQHGVEAILDQVREHMSADAYRELVLALASVAGVDRQAASSDSAGATTH